MHTNRTNQVTTPTTAIGPLRVNALDAGGPTEKVTDRHAPAGVPDDGIDARKPARPAPSTGTAPTDGTGSGKPGGAKSREAADATTLEELKADSPDLYEAMMAEARAAIAAEDADTEEEEEAADTEEEEEAADTDEEDDAADTDGGDDEAADTTARGKPATYADLNRIAPADMHARSDFVLACLDKGDTLDAARDRLVATLNSQAKRPGGETKPIRTRGAGKKKAAGEAADALGVGSCTSFDEAVDTLVERGTPRLKAIDELLADPAGTALREKQYGRAKK